MKTFTYLFSLILFALSLELQAEVLSTQNAIRTDTVVVTASRPSADDIDTELQTGRVTVIDKQSFDTSVATVADVLQKEAGVQIRQVGGLGSFSSINIRGSASSQVNVYVDGVLINGAYGGSVDLSQFMLGNVEQIEIYRGNTPVQLGSPGIGGSIHIRTSGAGVEPERSITFGTGSFETQKAAFAISDTFLNANTQFSVDYLASDNDFRLTNDNGTPLNPSDDFSDRRNNAGLEQSSFLLSTDISVDGVSSLGLIVQHLDKNKQLEDRNNSPSNQASYDTDTSSAQLKFNSRFNDDNAYSARFYLSNRIERFIDRSNHIGLQPNDEKSTTNATGISFFTSHSIGNHYLASHTEIQDESYRVESFADDSIVKYGRQKLVLGLQNEWISDDARWLVNGGTRFYYHDNDTEQADRSGVRDNFYGAQLGVLYRLNPEWEIRSNLSRDIRVPSMFELFGDRGYALGNEELVPETALNLDFGLNFKPGLIKASATVFYRDLNDAIVTIYNARGIGKADNISAATVAGIELETNYQASDKWQFIVKATSQDSEDTSSTTSKGNPLPGVATFESYFACTYTENEFTYTIEQEHRSGGFYDSQGNQAVLDLDQINFRAKWRSGKNAVELSLNNITNERTQQFNGFEGPSSQAFISFRKQF